MMMGFSEEGTFKEFGERDGNNSLTVRARQRAKAGHFLPPHFLLVCEKSKEVVFCRRWRQRTK